jgi:DNA-binding NtrC family response regulator
MNRPLPPNARLRVLVVEDEQRLRDLLTDELPRMGFDAVAARTAEQGLRAMNEQPCHIVILDLNLPVMDGMAFLEQFRPSWPDTPVIILTGFGNLETAKRAIDHEVTSFLSKPAHLGDIETALGKARLRLLRLSEQGGSHAQEDGRPASVRTLADLERQAIHEALQRNNGNRSATAIELGISRRTLYNRLAEYEAQGD